jgi:hypothetical protein
MNVPFEHHWPSKSDFVVDLLNFFGVVGYGHDDDDDDEDDNAAATINRSSSLYDDECF